MHAMIMDERSFVASSSCQSGLHAVLCANNWGLKKIYYWWCQLLTSFKIEIVTLFMPGKVHVRFYDFVTGFCKLEFTTIYSQQKGAEMQNTIFLFRWASCKLKYPLLLSCWTLDTSQKIDQVHNKSQRRYNIQHIHTKNGPCTSDQGTMLGRSC